MFFANYDLENVAGMPIFWPTNIAFLIDVKTDKCQSLSHKESHKEIYQGVVKLPGCQKMTHFFICQYSLVVRVEVLFTLVHL